MVVKMKKYIKKASLIAIRLLTGILISCISLNSKSTKSIGENVDSITFDIYIIED